MYFWLKFFHIVALAVWFSGLFLLPRLFVAQLREATTGNDAARIDSLPQEGLNALGKTLYFGVTTPAAVVTVILGIVLISYGFEGPWLPAKLLLVAVVVLLHIYLGQLLLDLSRQRSRHSALFYRVLNWGPLLLFLAIAALAAAKPGALPPLGGV